VEELVEDAVTSISQRETRPLPFPPHGSAGLSLRYPLSGTTGVVSRLPMTLHNVNPWAIGAGLLVLASVAALVLWRFLRKRLSAQELELARRQFLVQSGRIVDGMLLDVCAVDAEDGRTLTMLLFSYRIGGVDYECSQDVTDMLEVVDTAQVRAGFPCSVRYQPGNPQNSIVVAELWTGLRIGLPQLPVYEDPDPIDLSHLRPGRG
jgi:hypothetical protein